MNCQKVDIQFTKYTGLKVHILFFWPSFKTTCKKLINIFLQFKFLKILLKLNLFPIKNDASKLSLSSSTYVLKVFFLQVKFHIIQIMIPAINMNPVRDVKKILKEKISSWKGVTKLEFFSIGNYEFFILKLNLFKFKEKTTSFTRHYT